MNKLFAIILMTMLLAVSSASALVVLSMEQVSISSNSAQVSGEQWVLEVVLGQMNDKIEGYIEAEDIRATDDGVEKFAEKNLYLDAEITEKACTYHLDSSGNPILSLSQSQMTGWPFNDDDECFDSGGWIYSKESGELNGRCIYSTVKGINALVDFTGYQTAARLDLTINGQTESATINNFDNPDVSLGSRAHADWIGNLVSGDACEDARDKGIMAIMSSNGNKLTGENEYDQYNSYESSGFMNDLDAMWACMGSDFCSTDDTTQRIVDKFNNFGTAALREKTFRSTEGNVAVVSGNDVRIELDKAIQFPDVRLRIRASWLGIVIPVGEPEVVRVEADDFIEGQTGYLKVTVRNSGDYEGSFSLEAQCDDNIEVVGSVNQFRLDAGESDIINIPVKSIKDVSSSESDRCEVILTERTSDETDSKTVTMTVNQQTFCESGDQKCEGSQAYKCDNNGQWEPDAGNDDGCVISCTTDADCDDGDDTTIDACVSSGAFGSLSGKICQNTLDPDVAKLQCEAVGGTYVCNENSNGWKFWKEETETCNCLTPHLSVGGLILLILGILGIILIIVLMGGFPPLLILSILMSLGGLILLVLGGIGIV